MIARGRVLLPKAILVPAGDEPPPVEIDFGTYRATLYAPYPSELAERGDEVSLGERVRRLRRAVTPTEMGALMNGEPVFAADVIQVDFVADSFDRRHDRDDPPVGLLFEAVNGFIARFRTLGRAFQITEVSPGNTSWSIEYLNDDESELQPQQGFARRRVGTQFSIEFLGMPRTLWDRIHELPSNYRPGAWDELLLDAFGRLPHIGAAIVLGFSALEVRIEAALNDLSRLHRVRPEVWEWINDRGDYRKEPSTQEQFDSLLRAIGGRTLKEDNALWEAFQNLRKARNAFTHDGVAALGRVPVDQAQATQFLQKASEIIDWVDALLPEPLRRPPYDVQATYEAAALLEHVVPEAPAQHEP
jgi:hypothetical protein